MSVSPGNQGLLHRSDPDPVEWVNPASDAPILLLCEHAGQAVPQGLGDLGLVDGAIDTHIGWDVGAEQLSRAMAVRLGAPLILQRYSRLVIDCNRPPESPQSMPEVSDGIPVPANTGLTPENRAIRRRAIFDPLNQAIEQGFDRHHRRAAFSVHSYTPQLDGQFRSWHAGFLSRRDIATAQTLLDYVAEQAPDLTLAINQPYQVEDETDWFIPAHAEPRGIVHALLEIRNDQLAGPEGIDRWADLLAGAITKVLETNA